MNKKAIILIGGGGHCKSCIDVIEQENKYNITGIIDVPEKLGQKILGYEIIGNDDDIPSLAKQNNNFLITVGHLGNPQLRIKLFDLVKNNNGNLPVIISSLAYVSKHSKIEEGTIIMHKAVVNADATIGSNCIINTKALIEHDATIGNNSHISTGSIINGGVNVGNNCFYGSGSVSKEYINIANNTIIGANSLVRKTIAKAGIYAGNPVKKYK